VPTSDAIQHMFEVGDIVNLPCEVTAIGGTTAEPTVSLKTKYENFAGSRVTITETPSAIQVVKDM
jgi:hypothetical protein